MRRKFLLMTFLTLLLTAIGTSVLNAEGTNVAKVGNTEYATIDEAIANWTNNTTLTLLADVTLSDVIKLSSTEYHILDLGTYTMTAASGKDAIQYVVNGRSSASYALDIKADANNPGGITATGGSVVRHTKPLVSAPSKDRPITRFYGGVFNANYVVRQGGTLGAGYTGASAPSFYFYDGEYNGTIYTNRSIVQFHGGVFNGSIQMSVDSSSYGLVVGGTFKNLSNSMGSDLNSDKFTIGSAKGVYDKEVYIDENGNTVIAAAKPEQDIEADVAKNPGTNDYLAYSKVATEGQLGYTDVYTALEKNTSATVTVYVEELDLKDSNFKGTIVVPEGNDITITNIPKDANGNFTVEVLVGEEARTPSEDGTFTTIVPKEVATYDELVAALVNGGVIKLTDDIIAIGAVDGTDANIDLNGKTLKLNVGDNNFFGDSKVKNGSINITSCVASGDCIIGIGDNSNSATLTFDNVNVTGDGYSSAYAVLYVYNSSELNINGGSVVVSNDNASAGGVIKAHKAADGIINIVGTEGNPVELTFNNAKIGMLDGTVLMNYVDLDITGGANAINQSALTIINSTLDITGADGRALTLSQGNVVVENSTLNFSDCSEGEIRFKKSLELTADNNSTINTCTTYADASAIDAKINGVDVDASEGSMAVVTVVNGTTTVKEAPKGNDFTGYTSADAIWGETWGNASESFVIKVLDANGNVMGTTSLNNVGGIIDGDVNVTWNIKLDAASNTDEYWTMAWTTAPTIDNMPAKVELWVDGVKVSGGDVVLNGPDNINKIYAAVTDNTGKILAYHTNVQEAIKAAAAVTGGARTTTAGTVEFLADVTVDEWIMFSETLSIGNGQIITIEKIEGLTIDGNNHKLTINSIESAGNGNRLFYDATNLNIKDLTINYGEGVAGGIGLKSGTISNVNFNGGVSAIYPGAGEVIITDCTFKTSGHCIYFEEERDNLVVTNNTFELPADANVILLRGDVTFTGNNVKSGRTVNVVSGSPVVTGNNFNDVRFKVYNAASATISENTINNLVFNETDVPTESTFTDNTLSAEAQAAIDALPAIAGEGTEANPYLINDVDDLVWLQEKVDELAVDGSTQFAGKYFKLTNDIDLSGINWDPIGTMNDDHGSFKGVFDGGDHTISNLHVEQAGNGIGLFARTAGNAVIKNLKLNNVTVKSTNNSNYVGGLVGNAFASTKIENVHVSGNVYISGRGYIGGIAGHGYVVMDNVSVVATGDGQGNTKGLITSTFWCAGGVLGYAGEGATNIMNAHVENVVVTSAAGGLGAIVGMAEDNNGTQPISGSNLSAENVEIKTYTGAYGDAYANYALGYLYGGNPTSILTGDLSVEEVKIETSTGEAPEVNDAVAKIGNSIYFNLQDALNAAVENETITLLRDIKIAKRTEINNRTLTIDGNGKTIRQDENFDNTIAMFDINGGKVTIKNVTFDGVKQGAAVRTVYVEFAMDNVTAQNSEHTVDQGLFRLLGQNTITNSKFLNNKCSMVITLNYDVVSNTPQLVENCLFEGNECNSVAALYYVEGASCTIKNSEFVENTVNCNNNGATVYLGFTENNVVSGNIFQENNVIDASTSTRVAGAIFFGYEAEIENNVFVENTASNANNDVLGQICTSTYYDCTIDLSGNYWGGEAPEYGKDYTVQHTDYDGNFQLNNYYETYTTDDEGNVVLDNIVNMNYVAQVGKFSYETLAEAFAVAENETITLLRDTELSEMITIPNGKTVVLDLNGKTITGTDKGTASFGLITNKGNLTITDSSEEAAGKITLEAEQNRGWNAYSSVISNTVGGKLTVNGGTLEHLGGTDMAYAIDNLTNGQGTHLG